MTDLPPLLRDQRKIDAEHLQLLAIFHFVVAGLALVALGFVALHYFFMNSIFMNPKIWAAQKGGAPPPREIFLIFRIFYLVAGAFIVTGLIGNLISGFCLRARKWRTFSLVVAGLDCIQIPFGTVLGVFTIIVLVRESVRQLYEARVGAAAGPP